MLTLSPATRVLVAVEPVDGRLGCNGLYALVKQRLAADPLSGHLYLFTNRRRNRLKVLYWDGSGLWLCTKRLERGTFGWPQPGPQAALPWPPEQFLALAQGMEVTARRRWYRRAPPDSDRLLAR